MKKFVVSVLVVLMVLGFIGLSPFGGSECRAVEAVSCGFGQTTASSHLGIFGSRLNDNQHFDPDRRKSWSSTMGTFMDQATSDIIATRSNADGSFMRFAPSDQWYPEYPCQYLDSAATYRMLSGAHISNGTTLVNVTYNTNMHFVPSNSLGSPELKMAIAPFFFKDITVSNPTQCVQSGSLLITFDYATDHYKMGDTDIVYFQTDKDNGGKRCLAIKDSSATWGVGDGVFDYFARNGNLPNCHFGANEWSAGGFAVPFTLQPGQSINKTLVYGGYTNQDVMYDQKTGKGLKFLYTKFWRNIEEVVNYAFSQRDYIVGKSNDFAISMHTGDAKLDFIRDKSFQSYAASTWLVCDPSGDAYFYVSEGNFQYLSTVDVGYDIAFFEARYIPWALKMQLEQWSQFTGRDNYGLFLQHDMGVERTIQICGASANQYSGAQAYPRNMGVEENLDYVLMIQIYWKITGDTEFLKSKMPFVKELLSSVKNRDLDRDGIPDHCCYQTTFDFRLDHAISDANNNVYISVKFFSALIVFNGFCQATSTEGIDERTWALKICNRLKGVKDACGYLPVSLDINLPGSGDFCIANFNGLLPLFLTGVNDELIENLVSNTAVSHIYALQSCKGPYGYRVVTNDTRSWLSTTFSAKAINDIFLRRGHYAFSEDIIEKANALLSQSSLGCADEWDVFSGGSTGLLTCYPRLVIAIII